MSLAPDIIARPGPLAIPFTYLLGTTEQLRPVSAFAKWDGTGASGAFLPCLSFYDQNGNLFMRVFPSTSIAAGGTADVTYAPFQVALGSVGWQHNNAAVGTEPAADFKDSAGVTWTITDDPSNGRVTIVADVPSVESSGWIDDSAETWTYASGSGGGAASFTIAGTNLTAKYSLGARIRLTQSATVKYFNCTGSTFAGGNTTVNIMGGSSYTLANSAISANGHSYELLPQGWPFWFSYASNPVGWAGGPAGQATFAVVGGLCYIDIGFTGTSNSASTSFSLPIQAGSLSSASYSPISIADAGVSQTNPGRASVSPSATSCILVKDWANNPFTNSGTKVTNGLITYSLI